MGNDSAEDFRNKTIDTNDQAREIVNDQNLDQLMLIEDDCELFGNNYIIQGLNSGIGAGGLQSSRHIGTHELMPNLI